jgi:hypothetical protein
VSETGLAVFCQTCRATFRDHPFADRVRTHTAAVEHELTDPMPFYRLAAACWRAGRSDLMRECVAFAMARPHETHESVFRRAGERLRMGDWAGFADYEARHFRPRSGSTRAKCEHRLHWRARQWNGAEDISQLTLLIADEGGFGDSLQVMCFIPEMVKRAKRIILMYRSELVHLVEHNFGDCAQVIPYTGDFSAVRFDRFILGFTMPWASRGLPEFRALRSPEPVVNEPDAFRSLRRVGLCWASARYGTLTNPTPRPSDRSVPALRLLEPLLTLPDMEWHSLQVGERASEADIYPCIRQRPKQFKSFAETANFVAGLDYVVTIDTAMAHLAGRLGIPTFVLLPFDPDWRWGFGFRTPWYPSLRLIRHPRPGDWENAISELARQFKESRHLSRAGLAAD